MQTLKFKDRDEWISGRRGRITGSRLSDIVSKRGGRKLGSYELAAERLGIPADDESAMERGTRLEPEALDRFSEETGKDIEKGDSSILWIRDDLPGIAITPDGFVVPKGKKKKITEAVETKCLSSARHLQAIMEQKVPSDYELQMLQYFIVNDDLETLYFVFYDPRFVVKDFFYLTIKREEVAEKISEYFEYQKQELEWVEHVVKSLTF